MSSKFAISVFAAVIAMTSTALAQDSWADKVTLGGDVRYRIQSENKTKIGDEEVTNTKQRFRLRWGGTGKINDQWTGGFRLATGGATSRDQDMGSFHNVKDINVDRAFMKFMPSESTSVMYGKFGTMFWAAGGNQVIWNQNISSEGVEINHAFTVGDMKPSLNLSYHSVYDTGFNDDNTQPLGPDVNMFGAQFLVPFKSESMHATLGIASFNYSSLKGLTAATATGDNKVNGNLTSTTDCREVGGTCFVNDFALLNAGLEIGLNLAHNPVTLFVDYTQNTKAEKDDGNKAIISGLTLGKASAPGSWQVGVHYRDVARDAVVGALTDSGFLTTTTGVYGTGVDLAYGLADNVIMAASYQTGAYVGYEKHQRMQIQLDAKF